MRQKSTSAKIFIQACLSRYRFRRIIIKFRLRWLIVLVLFLSEFLIRFFAAIRNEIRTLKVGIRKNIRRVGVIGFLFMVIGFAIYKTPVKELISYYNQSKLVITAIPVDKNGAHLGGIGKKDALYEFILNKSSSARVVKSFKDFKKCITNPINIRPVSCDTSRTFYKLTIISQNQGKSLAGKHEIAISFSGEDTNSVDPNVRVGFVATDDMELVYLMNDSLSHNNLPLCLKDYSDSIFNPEYKPSNAIKETYKSLGLSRDFIILQGSLNPGFVQIVDLVIQVPLTTNHFYILYNLHCPTCGWLNKNTIFYAQRILVNR